jgi:hypothetical protein
MNVRFLILEFSFWYGVCIFSNINLHKVAGYYTPISVNFVKILKYEREIFFSFGVKLVTWRTIHIYNYTIMHKNSGPS